MAFTALLDSNVLYSAPLRDLVLHLALTDLFRARWSDLIHEEWISNLLKNRPDLSRDQLERTRSLMDEAVPDGRITGFEELIPVLALPDPSDRHVLAAAIVGRVDVIVTKDLKGFPADRLDPYGLDALDPDTFVEHLLHIDPDQVVAAARSQRATLTRPPRNASDFLDTLDRHGLFRSVRMIRGLHAADPARFPL